MSINFIPNDPDVNSLPMRVVNPRADRGSTKAGFDFMGIMPEKKYDPDTESDGFLFWQSREAALVALEAWENFTGTNFSTWQPGKKIKLIPNAGIEPNAFYDRDSVSFFEFITGGKTFFSGASTDVVAHEVGHGILDAIRPSLIESNTFEVNAFHEAFGDCVAVLTAFHDQKTRDLVRSSLASSNDIEATAENLSRAIKEGISNGDIKPKFSNAGAPRRARNTFQWQLPSTLPVSGAAGSGPGKLINEIHCFGQIFSGCFYDLLINLFTANGGTSDAQFLAAIRTAANLLAKAAALAPEATQFFREIGRSMVKVDEVENGAANKSAIKSAFEGHNIPLGVGAMFAPVAALAGDAPTFKAAAVSVGTGIRNEIFDRLGSKGKLAMNALRIGKDKVANLVHDRLLDCGKWDKRLKGVVAIARDSILLGDSGGRAAFLGNVPEPTRIDDDVESYVKSLLAQGAIYFGDKSMSAIKTGMVASGSTDEQGVTHRIKIVAGKKTLTRFRYACRCCS